VLCVSVSNIHDAKERDESCLHQTKTKQTQESYPGILLCLRLEEQVGGNEEDDEVEKRSGDGVADVKAQRLA